MERTTVKKDPVQEAESAVFLNANRLISDTQRMRTDPAEALPNFKERTTALALAALELISHHASPEDAQAIVQTIANHYLSPSEQQAAAV